MALFRNSLTGNWRRGPELNRRIEVLQTSALPLGYRALLGMRKVARQSRHRKPKHDPPPRFRTAVPGSDARSADTACSPRPGAPRKPHRTARSGAPRAGARTLLAAPGARKTPTASQGRRGSDPRARPFRWRGETSASATAALAPARTKKRRRTTRSGARETNVSSTQAFVSPAAGAGASAAGAAVSAGALALALPLPFAARRPEDFL